MDPSSKDKHSDQWIHSTKTNQNKHLWMLNNIMDALNRILDVILCSHNEEITCCDCVQGDMQDDCEVLMFPFCQRKLWFPMATRER